MDNLNKLFGKKIRARRKERGLSQDKLAEKSKIDRSYIGRIDRGEVNITIDKLYTLADALECSPCDLLP